MLYTQLVTTIPQLRNHTRYYVLMTALVDSGYVPQKNFPFNNFREPNRQYILKHSVESRMLYPHSVIY